MGQEISWPCVIRKEQNKRIMSSKYDPSFHTENTPGGPNDETKREERLHNLDKIQDIIQRKSYGTSIPLASDRQTPTSRKGKSDHPSPAMTRDEPDIPAVSFTEGSHGELEGEVDLPFVFLSEEIENIHSFIHQMGEKYPNTFLSIITPNPSKARPVVAMQAINIGSEINGPAHYRYYDFEKDFSKINNHNAYQILVKFFKDHYANGMDYLGYYLDEKGHYHFIFYELLDQPKERTNLAFFSINGTSQEEIQATLDRAVKEQYKLKGMITLLDNTVSTRPLSFIIFEQKKQKVEQYIMVGVGSNTFDKEGANFDFSRKIEVACQSDDLEVVGMLTCHEEDLLYLVFGQSS